jgi:dihydroorotase
LNYFVEVTPAHLTLDESILSECDKICLVEPPLREKSNVIFLRKMFWEGAIDVVGTDHAPHTLEEKLSDKPPAGFPGLETAVPILFTNPAKIFNLRGYGAIREGNVANLTLIKFVPEYRIDSSKFYSKAKFTPFEGFKVEAAVTKTIIRGETVYERGAGIVGGKRGKVVRT